MMDSQRAIKIELKGSRNSQANKDKTIYCRQHNNKELFTGVDFFLLEVHIKILLLCCKLSSCPRLFLVLSIYHAVV